MKMTTSRIENQNFRTRKVAAYPGDTRLRLTAPVTTVDGATLGRGSIIQPLCGGACPGGHYAEVTVLLAR